MKKLLILIIAIAVSAALFSGCNGVTTNKKIQIGGLEMNHLVYCSTVNGDRDYVEKTDKTFAPGETFYLYFEVSGLKYKKDGNEIVYHPVISIEIKDADGNTVIPETTVIDKEIRGNHSAAYLYFPITFTMPSDTKDGKYTTIVKVKDAFGKGHITSSSQFLLKS